MNKLALASMIPALALASCAAPMAPRWTSLSGTDWTVQSVNGRATPAQGRYSMQFEADGRFGARFGCNSMGGRYVQSGPTVTVSNLNQTLIGCPEPSATFERQGSAILQQPMQIVSTAGGVNLSNPAGTIALTRTP